MSRNVNRNSMLLIKKTYFPKLVTFLDGQSNFSNRPGHLARDSNVTKLV